MAPMKSRRQAGPRRRRVWRRRAARPGRPMRRRSEEYASCRETHQFALLSANDAYYDYEASLARCARASAIGKNYREFCITKLEYVFKPKADTFMPGGPYTVPTLLYMIDKTGAMRDIDTAEELRRAGAKPIRFDDKQIRVSFKPAVLQYARDEAGSSNLWAKPVTSPWLSTNKYNDDSIAQAAAASSVDHLGIVWMVEQTNAGQDVIGYEVELVLHFKFRKPTYLRAITTEGGAIQAPSVSVEVDSHST